MGVLFIFYPVFEEAKQEAIARSGIQYYGLPLYYSMILISIYAFINAVELMHMKK
jgi:hypothetical protein